MKSQAIVLPAFKEEESIEEVISQLLAIVDWPKTLLVVVDDSPDGISAYHAKEAVAKAGAPEGILRIVLNNKKTGRGFAVRLGFNEAKSVTSIWKFVEMDSDGSHQASDVLKILAELDAHDFVIGSRYLKQSKISGWPFSRRVFSRTLNRLIRFKYSIPVMDWTNGLRGYSLYAVEHLLETPQKTTGFIYLTEQLLLLNSKEIYPLEIPINFVNRTSGQSTVTYREIVNSLIGILKLKKL